jgi:hypothetical protein
VGLERTNAESVQHHSPGQAHVSATNVSAALGYGAVQWVGRAGDSKLGGRFAEAEMGPAMRRSNAVRDGQRRRGSASAHRARLLAFGAHDNVHLDNGTTIWIRSERARRALVTD